MRSVCSIYILNHQKLPKEESAAGGDRGQAHGGRAQSTLANLSDPVLFAQQF